MHRDMYPHISFFMFLGIRKERYPAALKDYSLFVSWLSSLLLVSNIMISRHINSYEDIELAPPSLKISFKKDDTIIRQKFAESNINLY